MSTSDHDIVILGAGPAGLSAAIEADRLGRDAVLIEAADAPGGLTRSFEQDGYTFDCSGHLLHLSDPDALALVEQATPPEAWNRIARNSVIYIGGAMVPYPFQQHLAFAPEEIRRECLDLLPAEPPTQASAADYADFGEWINAKPRQGNRQALHGPLQREALDRGGRGTDLRVAGPLRSPAQPRRHPPRRRVQGGVETGYNRSFLYPSHGGIATLPNGLAKLVPNLLTNTRAVEIDTEARRVRTEDGREFGYESGVVGTLPLPQLAAIVRPHEDGLDAADKLRANSVTCVNLGLKRANPEFSQYQWIYLPEGRFAAYRVGFFGRFADTMAPPGRESVYIEIAHEPGRDEGRVVEEAIADLIAMGAIDAPTTSTPCSPS